MAEPRETEPQVCRLAAHAWDRGDKERGRNLYRQCVDAAGRGEGHLGAAFYLCEWARHEGVGGDRIMFERLYGEAIVQEPNAPFVLLSYARETWTSFRDGAACLERVAKLEKLLNSDTWERASDLSPRAYEQKIETVRAWVRGEPGGPLWP